MTDKEFEKRLNNIEKKAIQNMLKIGEIIMEIQRLH